MPRWIKIVLLIIAILLTALIAVGLPLLKIASDTMMAQFGSMPPQPETVTSTVVTTPVNTEVWTPKLSAVGTLKSVHGIGVTSETPGVITEILFESNQPVAEGDILVKLDASIQLANIDSFRTQLKQAKTELSRQQKLRKRGVTTQADLDRATTQVAQLNAQLAAQRAILEQKIIRAPFAGRMGLRHVSIGQYLTPGTPIATLGTVDPIYIDFALPEKHVPVLKPGLTIRVRVDAFPNDVITGTLTSTELIADARTHTIGVRGTLPNDGRLRPGTFGQVDIVLPQTREVLAVPQTAVAFNPYGKSVWVITEKTEDQYPVPDATDGQTDHAWHIEQRFIKTGETRGDFIEIVDGLAAGDQIVTTGQLKLRPGVIVMFNNDAAPAARTE